MDVVVILRPIVADKDHKRLLGGHRTCSSPRAPGDKLMDQCSAARHPISATGTLTNRPGRDLALEVDTRFGYQQRSPTGGSETASPDQGIKDRRLAVRFPLAIQPYPQRLFTDVRCRWRAAGGAAWRSSPASTPVAAAPPPSHWPRRPHIRDRGRPVRRSPPPLLARANIGYPGRVIKPSGSLLKRNQDATYR